MNRLSGNTARKTAIAAALLLAATVLTACDKKDDKPAASAPATSTPSTTAPSTAAPATPAPSSTAPSSAAPAPASTASAGDVPAECDAYIRKVNACMDKLGANSPAVATFRQQLDAARTQWASVSDKTALAAQCKQSTDLFTQSAAQMGCE
ncbi:glutaconyl-CoA decarboxylase subunit gamma [Bordetella genomosp. 10]|uniref:Glutaconyl-CoA decarboxylase subunit gamma n=1 Tax=Bordetella genomosp. 10 TaxID=1416804 RepID=A0A261S4Q3_9BORD|nr:glutaconyl-CoA decarboxylase subunit gamma [Bordetella genomosp. 10]OZI32338.1 glutaconyl-CoA decarboxylase subunit gamma [Bordetella genomosp. 10]